MNSPKLIAVIIAVISLAWVMSGVLFAGEKNPALATAPAQHVETADQKPVDVRVRDMEAQDYADDVIVTGRTQASRRVELKAETGGQITAILREEGAKIANNDVLAELEIRDRAARVKEARERVQQRQIEYDAAKKLQDKGFNSKVKLTQALADLEDARAALKQAEVEQNKTKITAPFEGMIAEQHAEMGDYLAVGDPVFTLVDLDPVEFVGYISERRIQDMQVGSAATAEFLDGQTIAGTISYIAPAADQKTRTFRVIISAPNELLAIKEGLTARIRIPVAQKRAYKISPAILTLNDAGQVGVKIVDGQNKVQFVPVAILADEPTAMYVTGLPGDTARIITVGQEFVMEGQAVNPVPSAGDGLL